MIRRLLGLLRSALHFELALYRSLARWAVRRPDVPAGATPIGYAQLVAPMLWLWIFGSAVEVVALEIVLRHIDQPWASGVRVPMLVLGIWGLAWMLGLMASYRVRPHLLSEQELTIRSGARTWLTVPLGALGSVRVVDHETSGILRSLHLEGTLALVDAGGRTNLELVLTGPTLVSSSAGALAVDRVALWVDDPREIAALLGQGLRAPS